MGVDFLQFMDLRGTRYNDFCGRTENPAQNCPLVGTTIRQPPHYMSIPWRVAPKVSTEKRDPFNCFLLYFRFSRHQKIKSQDNFKSWRFRPVAWNHGYGTGTLVDAGWNILILFQLPDQYRKCRFDRCFETRRSWMSLDVFPGIPFILPDHPSIGWNRENPISLSELISFS